MQLFSLYLKEAKDKPLTNKFFVVYGGRFQPFHPGHYDVYKKLLVTYPNSDIFIATSNVTQMDPHGDESFSPFNFAEKKEIAETLYHDVIGKIHKCKSPTFSPWEITNLPDNKDKAIVLIVSEKDRERYENAKNYRELPEALIGLVPANQGVYYYTVVEMEEGGLSATQVREKLMVADTQEASQNFVNIYGSMNTKIFELIREKLT